MTAVFANRLLFLKWLKNGAEMFSNRLVHHKKKYVTINFRKILATKKKILNVRVVITHTELNVSKKVTAVFSNHLLFG